MVFKILSNKILLFRSYRMDSRHKVAFLKARIKLLKDLDLSDLLEYLIQWGIISIEDSAKIKVNETQGGQAQCLLDILPRRGARAFEDFSRALLQTNQRHLQEALHETLDNVTAGKCTSKLRF